MNIKANKKNILVGIIVVIIIGIIGIVCYDRITVNNQYYIGEKNLEIPIFVYHNIVNDSSEINMIIFKQQRIIYNLNVHAALIFYPNAIT